MVWTVCIKTIPDFRMELKVKKDGMYLLFKAIYIDLSSEKNVNIFIFTRYFHIFQAHSTIWSEKRLHVWYW